MGKGYPQIQQDVGNRIRELREKRNHTQESLALKSGLDRTYINSVENGRRNISVHALEKIIFALDCTFKSFFSLEWNCYTITNIEPMEKFVTLRLPQNDVGQILDGLTQRMITWKTTEEYLETGISHFGDFIEECSDPEEARFIAQYYEKIIDLIYKQLENQKL